MVSMTSRLRQRRTTGRPATRRGRRGAFTLIEAMIVMMIVGLGVTAMLELLASGTVANVEGTELTTAVNLANNVREIALDLEFRDPQDPDRWSTRESSIAAYDDVLDLDHCNFSPPLDVNRLPMGQYEGWTQKVRVRSVDPDALTREAAHITDEPIQRVTVTITHGGRTVYQTSWLAVVPSEDK